MEVHYLLDGEQFEIYGRGEMSGMKIPIGFIKFKKKGLYRNREYFGISKSWILRETIFDDTSIYLENLYIEPLRRGNNHGNQLMVEFIRRCKAEGYDFIILESIQMFSLKTDPKVQTRLNKFYERHGFEVIHQNKDLSQLMYLRLKEH